MFENIGKKIKSLAKIVFVIEAAFLGFVGLVLMLDGNGEGFLVLVAGVLGAWISGLFLYGFGEIIDKLTDIEKNTRNETNRYASND